MYKFTHHDLLANNISYHEELGVKFIDFEYASIDIISFDIANFFNESQFNYSITEFPFFEVVSGPID